MISLELLIIHSLGNFVCHNASRMMTQESRHNTKVIPEHTKKIFLLYINFRLFCTV